MVFVPFLGELILWEIRAPLASRFRSGDESPCFPGPTPVVEKNFDLI